MNRDAIGGALRDLPVPVPDGAEERGLRVVRAAYAERESRDRVGLESRRPLPRLALALALAALLTALLFSPAGAAVRDWVGHAFTASTPRPQPTLAEVPGGGQLLVQSAVGPWVVKPDGSRRLLGDYPEATWSPHGLFVAVIDNRTLSAVEPDGDPHWSITAPGRVRDPRWSPSGERIAYRSGRDLRMIAADGTEDRLLAGSIAAVAPSWSPAGDTELAYVSGGGLLRIVNGETGEGLTAAPALHRITRMEWGAGGRAILEASPGKLRARQVRARKPSLRVALGEGRMLPLPPGATVVDAAIAPQREVVAAVLTRWKKHGIRSTVVVFGAGASSPQRLLTVPGSLGEVAWSPDGRRLLIAWPYADQWLFLPVGRGRGRAVANVSSAFAPGRRGASFPRVEGWCCRP